MHESLYSQAVLPGPARVLGLNLLPYSLGHELWLIREQNPLAIALNSDNAAVLASSLPSAVLLCSQTWSEISAMNRDKWIGVKLKLWNLRLKKFNFGRELAAFLDYRTRGTLSFQDEPPSVQPGRPFGCPLLCSLHQFIRARVANESDAWDYPYGRAQMEYAAWLEGDGRLKIKNKFEMEHDRSFAEWEKENPENSLEVADA